MTTKLTGLELLQFLVEKSPEEVAKALEHIHPADILDALEDYEGDPFIFLVRMPNDVLAAILDEAEEDDKGKLLDLFPSHQKTDIMSEMASDELADLLGNLDPEEAAELIHSMDEEKASQLKDLLKYDPETAGGIMATEFVSISTLMNVEDTLKYLQIHGEDAETLNYLYILNPEGVLKGVVALRDIVVRPFGEPLTDLINPNVISVPLEMDQEEVGHIFQKYGFSSIPVVDDEQRMMGIITADDMMEVIVEESTEDFERMGALAHNEGDYLETGVFGLARRRIFWLFFLMISATFTGMIIERYEAALAQVVVLMAFVPMLMDTGGNAGSQSSTLIIRGMALGKIDFKDFFAVLSKEIRVSAVVGVMLGAVNMLRIWLMKGDWMLGITVSLAMFATVMAANLVGCTLPLLARKIKVDPAIMAAPVITTIVDALALIVYFWLATKLYIPV